MKKGNVTYELGLLWFSIAILILVMVLSQEQMKEKIGIRQIQVSSALGEAELKLFSVDQRAKYAVYDSITELGARGGFLLKPNCGDQDKIAFWAKKGKAVDSCFPNFMEEFSGLVKLNLERYGIRSENYDLYVDNDNVIGITAIADTQSKTLMYNKLYLGKFDYYTKPSFNIQHDYPFEDYESLKRLAKDIMKCADSSEAQIESCVTGKKESFTRQYGEKFSITSSRVPETRLFTFEVKQKRYKNIFTGDVVIKFALGLELRIHPEAFTNTKAAVWNGSEEKSFNSESQANIRLPEKITVEIPLAEYQGRRAEISFDFGHGDKSVTSTEVTYIKSGKTKKFTHKDSKFKRSQFMAERGNDPVHYYVKKEATHTFYIPIPKGEDTIVILAEYTAGEEYRNIVEVSFKDLVDVPEKKPSPFFEGQIIPLDAFFENFVLIGDPDTEFPIIFLKEKNLWIPNTDFTIEEGKLLLNGEEAGFPLRDDYAFEANYGNWDYNVYYTLTGDAEPSPLIYLIERTDRISRFLEVYTSLEFINEDGDTWEKLKRDAEFDYLSGLGS